MREAEIGAGGFLGEDTAIREGEEAAAMERIDPIARTGVFISHDEMAGQADAIYGTAEPSGDFDVDDGERDRDAEAA